MRVAETVSASYRLLFANLGAFLAAATFWTLLATVPRALTLVEDAPSIKQYEVLIQVSPFFLAIIFASAGSICLGIVWHRVVILREPAARIVPTTDVVGRYTVRAMASLVLPLSFFIAVAWIYRDDSDSLALNAATYAGTSMIYAALARLLLVLPASATGDTATTVRVSLTVTRGRTAAIFFGLLACDLPWNILSFATDAAIPGDDTGSLEATVNYSITLFLNFARVVTWTAFLSYAYLEFVRPAQTQADHFS